MLPPATKKQQTVPLIDSNFEKLNSAGISHILSRTKIIFSSQEMETWNDKSLFLFLQNLININTAGSSLPVKDYSSSPSLQPDNHILYGNTWIYDISTDIHINRKRKNSLKVWFLNDLLKEGNTLKGCMILFWLDFFKIDISSFSNANKAYKYLEIIRSKSMSSQLDILIDLITENIFTSYFKKFKPERIPINKFTCTEILKNYFFGDNYEQIVSKEKLKKLFRLLNEWTLILDTVSIRYSNLDGKIIDESTAFQEFIHNKVVVREFMENLRSLLLSLLKQPEASIFMAKKIVGFFVSRNEEADNALIHQIESVISLSKTDVTSFMLSLLSNPNFFHENIIKNYPRTFVEVLIILLLKKNESESDFLKQGNGNLENIIQIVEKDFLSGADFFSLFSDRYKFKPVEIFGQRNSQLMRILKRKSNQNPSLSDSMPSSYNSESNIDLLFK